MKFQVVSFDLQGTLSDLSFSEEFWNITLPALYSRSKNVPFDEAKNMISNKSKEIGAYDWRYYSVKYWTDSLGLNLSVIDALGFISSKPRFYNEYLPYLKELGGSAKLIIISTACREFIDVELGSQKKLFTDAYSAVDDFEIGGKPSHLYTKICKRLNVAPQKTLHIGDDYEMDVKNAKLAGVETFYFNAKSPKTELAESLKNFLRV